MATEGAPLDFEYREVEAAQAIMPMHAARGWRPTPRNGDAVRRSESPTSAGSNTFVTDVALPAGLANICRTNGQAAKRENPLSLVVSEFCRDLISIESEVAKMNK